MMRVATFDLGTNTFRVLIAEIREPGNREPVNQTRTRRLTGSRGHGITLRPIRVLRSITRLGQDLHKRKTFHPDAVKRSLAALDDFAREIRTHRVDWAGGICTAAFRTAKDGPRLLARIRKRYGWDVRIVSARQEATYAMRGIIYGLKQPREPVNREPVNRRKRDPVSGSRDHGITGSPLLVVDIGGGSTEFILCDKMRGGGSSDPPGKREHLKMLPYQTKMLRHLPINGARTAPNEGKCQAFGGIRGIQTTPLGVVRLTETHLHHDPPLLFEMRKLDEAINAALAPVERMVSSAHLTRHPSPVTRRSPLITHHSSLITSFVGTAGTVTTLAALKMKMRKYDPKKISGTRLTRRDLESLMRRLIAVPAAARLKLPGMEKGREDLILAGIAILLRCMDRFGLPALTVCDSGILEGIALSHSRNAA
ncbi:MAG: hypothetical protein HYT87_13630 [Nitrospirae bacterium]|nr:hypothetical protein [Nitrospirota bacterium]